MSVYFAIFGSNYNRNIVVHRVKLKLSFFGCSQRNSYKRPPSNAFDHKEKTRLVSTWTVSQMHLDNVMKETPIKHQSTSWTVATIIESGSQSLNSRRLHRDGACGRGFCKARINVFGNSDDPGRLPFPIHL